MTSQDAIELLLDDHERLSRALAILDGCPTGRRRERLLGELYDRLSAHFRSEEAVFYPACQEFVLTRAAHDAFNRCASEHQRILQALSGLDAGNQSPSRATGAFHLALERHIRWEEKELFAAARRGLSRSDLLEVAKRMRPSSARRTAGGPRARRHVPVAPTRGELAKHA